MVKAMRGQIYFVKLEPRSGSEQAGTRPCIVISSNAFNEVSSWRSITVLPLTSAERWLEPRATTVILNKGEANLPRKSAALAHQLTTVDRSKLMGQAVGKLSDELMTEVEKAVLNYLEISLFDLS